MGTTLVANPGSSSRKYALFVSGKQVVSFWFENTKKGFEMCSQLTGGQSNCQSIEESEFNESLKIVAQEVDKYLFRESLGNLDNVVIRVVAPGRYFQRHQKITDEFINLLESKQAVSPIHVPVTLKEIKSAQKIFKGTPLFSASDSHFHREMPSVASEYSIDSHEAGSNDIHRFGFHGLSVASIVRKIHPLIGIEPERMIVCHVGSGVSVTAVKSGKGVDTTMGFSPSSGLPMGTRAGDLDSTALLEIMRVNNFRVDDARTYLATRGGLSGLAGEPDIRKLLDRVAKGDKIASLALNKFSYEIKKSIAAMTVPLGGLDVLVLTATAAVRSSKIREMILSDLNHLGIEINPERNNCLVGNDGVISVHNSIVKVVVMRTDEMGEMVLVPNLVKD